MAILQLEYFCIINAVVVVVLLLGLAMEMRAEDERGFSHQVIMKKNRCLNPPRTARRVETVIAQCQEEVKHKLLNEALAILKVQVSETPPTTTTTRPDGVERDSALSVNEVPQTIGRMKRHAHDVRRIEQPSPGIYHPTLVPMEDKRIAGCLLHCVYAKNNAIDKNGWPTLDGLVHFYSEGVHEHGFFMATLRSVNLCLRAVTQKYQVNRWRLPQRGESCDLAFDVFDCISDQITGYCLDQYRN